MTGDGGRDVGEGRRDMGEGGRDMGQGQGYGIGDTDTR